MSTQRGYLWRTLDGDDVRRRLVDRAIGQRHVNALLLILGASHHLTLVFRDILNCKRLRVAHVLPIAANERNDKRAKKALRSGRVRYARRNESKQRTFGFRSRRSSIPRFLASIFLCFSIFLLDGRCALRLSSKFASIRWRVWRFDPQPRLEPLCSN